MTGKIFLTYSKKDFRKPLLKFLCIEGCATASKPLANLLNEKGRYYDHSKAKADKADELADELCSAYSSIGSIAKAINTILYDPALIIGDLPPQQERLLKAIPNYAISWAEKAGFNDIAEDIQKHYVISKGIKIT